MIKRSTKERRKKLQACALQWFDDGAKRRKELMMIIII
jgi:hypothetical protein